MAQNHTMLVMSAVQSRKRRLCYAGTPTVQNTAALQPPVAEAEPTWSGSMPGSSCRLPDPYLAGGGRCRPL